MKEAILKIEERASNQRILIVGDVMLDKYVVGSSDRISPESPVPVVNFSSEEKRLGGAGNVAMNTSGLGFNCDLVALLGNDQAGGEIKALLEERNCGTNGLVFFEGRSTTEKTRILANKQQVVRLDKEVKGGLSADEKDTLKKKINDLIVLCDIVVLSDYGKGVLEKDFCQWIVNQCLEIRKPILVDPKGKRWSKYKGADLITPNLKEAQEVVPFDLNDDSDIEKACVYIQEEFDIKNVLITRGGDGMTLLESGQFHRINAKKIEVFDVSGAGDTVISSIACMLSLGFSYIESALLSNEAAGVVVTRIGTHPISFDELKEEVVNGALENPENKVLSALDLVLKVNQWKEEGKKIVFTNGCFDIIHLGHTSLLHAAKERGDKLIVGLNTDKSVKRLKGDERPINDHSSRAKILTYLSSVDAVCLFNEDTPYELIKSIQPDIIVKGGDYKPDEVVGADIVKKNNGEVVIFPTISGYSTSNLVNKIEANS